MKNKKKVIALVLAVALVVAAVGTTLAWLTSTNEIKNTFTVGTFTEPTTDPKNSAESLFDTNGDLKSGTLDGNLYEKSWNSDADHQLIPGVEFAKDPYVGIGPGSEDGVVYPVCRHSGSVSEISSYSARRNTAPLPFVLWKADTISCLLFHADQTGGC